MPSAIKEGVSVSAHAKPSKVGEYKVFWNNMRPKKILMLHFPNNRRGVGANGQFGTKPLEVRIKPRSGLVEVDIPIGINKSYNKDQGIRFGTSVKQSRTLQTNNDYGLAGGFGSQILPKISRNGVEAITLQAEDETERFEEAVQEGLVLDKITLGGLINVSKSKEPMYALGTFSGDELYLTKVDAICMLQPQFQHLDAATEQERSANRVPTSYDAGETEARAVNMTIKSADDDELDMGEVGKTIKNIQEERWQRLSWIEHRETMSSWTLNKNLLVHDEHKSAPLVSAMTERQYLDAISAPRRDPIYQGQRVMRSRRWSSDTEQESDPLEGEASELV